MPDRSTAGHVGDPRQATAEKGEALFAAFSAATVSMIERMAGWDGTSWNG